MLSSDLDVVVLEPCTNLGTGVSTGRTKQLLLAAKRGRPEPTNSGTELPESRTATATAQVRREAPRRRDAADVVRNEDPHPRANASSAWPSTSPSASSCPRLRSASAVVPPSPRLCRPRELSGELLRAHGPGEGVFFYFPLDIPVAHTVA